MREYFLFFILFIFTSYVRWDPICVTSDTRESNALCQNNALGVSPTSGNGKNTHFTISLTVHPLRLSY